MASSAADMTCAWTPPTADDDLGQALRGQRVGEVVPREPEGADLRGRDRVN